MKPSEIKIGASYRKSSLYQQLRQGERLVVKINDDPARKVTYRCGGVQCTVLLSNFARWAEIEVLPPVS